MKKQSLQILHFLPVFIFFIFSGCAINRDVPIENNKIVELNAKSSMEEYILGVGDKIAIKFFFNNSLNEEVVVRPDGKISLQLIDDVQAAGLTVPQLDSVLTGAYAKALKTSSEKYVLAVGDQIAIKSYYHDKLNDRVIVRPDGKISLLLIDEVKAAGKTPKELDAILTKKYSSFLDSPDVAVSVISFNRPDLSIIVNEFKDQKIYIGGEVARPSIVRLNGRLRILDAIIHASGPLESGDLKHVTLIRQGKDNSPVLYTVNMKNIINGISSDIWLKNYDIVIVPKTGVANIESYIRTHLWDLIPDQIGLSFLYDMKNEIQVRQE